MSLERLMLRREHFPIEIGTNPFGGFIDYSISIPPYHPSMHISGIDLDLAVSVLDEALENTKSDLKYLAKNKIVHLWRRRRLLERGQDGKIRRGDVVESSDEHRLITPFPLMGYTTVSTRRDPGCLYIGKRKIAPNPPWDNFIWMPDNGVPNYYIMPPSVSLPSELIDEYELEVRRYDDGSFSVRAPYSWERCNIDHRNIFYNNFVIALNNAVVRRKHSSA